MNVKHGIITDKDIARHLGDIAKKRNVCFVDDFRKIRMSDTISEDADVIWVIGTPRRTTNAIWQRAQMLFGNAEEPLSYENDIETWHLQRSTATEYSQGRCNLFTHSDYYKSGIGSIDR